MPRYDENGLRAYAKDRSDDDDDPEDEPADLIRLMRAEDDGYETDRDRYFRGVERELRRADDGCDVDLFV
jgi:hypothetical protein